MKVTFIKRDRIKMKIRLFVNNVDNKPYEKRKQIMTVFTSVSVHCGIHSTPCSVHCCKPHILTNVIEVLQYYIHTENVHTVHSMYTIT